MQYLLSVSLVAFLFLSHETFPCSAHEGGLTQVHLSSRKLEIGGVEIKKIRAMGRPRYTAAGTGTSSSLAIRKQAFSLRLWGSLLGCLMFFVF